MHGPSPPPEGGVCLWLTGLSGAGKSTTAEALMLRLADDGRTVGLLDGDAVRRQLSSDLTFSRADRETNVLRVARLARTIVDSGGIAVCALVSPYRDVRRRARQIVGEDRFIEIFVDTPLSVCEARDTKGLYARARRGLAKGLTGVDDPYEPPLRPELAISTDVAVALNVERIVTFLTRVPHSTARARGTRRITAWL